MAAKKSFRAENCCYLVSEQEAFGGIRKPIYEAPCRLA